MTANQWGTSLNDPDVGMPDRQLSVSPDWEAVVQCPIKRLDGHLEIQLDQADSSTIFTVLLLLDKKSLACRDVVAIVRARRACLPPDVRLLVICPEPMRGLESCPAYTVTVSHDVIGLGRALGLDAVPGCAVLDSAGGVLWVSDGLPRLAGGELPSGPPEGRTTGALALGDILG